MKRMAIVMLLSFALVMLGRVLPSSHFGQALADDAGEDGGSDDGDDS